MKVSNVADKIQPSLTRQLFDRAKGYDNVIDLTLGDPDYPTPSDICKAGCKAINEGKTKYTANAGLIELRKAVTDVVRKETGIEYDPETEVIITVGAMGALYLLIKSYINAGDEVLIPGPYWINYAQMTTMSGGVPVIVNGDENNGFSLSVETIEKAITSKTRMMIINSPCNPTGEIYSKETLSAITEIAIKYNILVVSDEAYSCIVYDDARFESIVNVNGMENHTVLVNSFSKRYSMTGWRVGYAIGDANIISAMTRFQENVASCCPQPSQYAAIQALKGSQESVRQMVKGYQKRRDLLVEGINRINKLSCRSPQGTFYAFVNIKETGLSSVEFAYSLLDSVKVAVVPGVTYGEAGEGYIRIAFTQDEAKLSEAIERIGHFIGTLC